MYEDKLTHDERLKLECLAQAIASQATRMKTAGDEELLSTAKKFEAYVKQERSKN